jgi:D-sedoheptulose 7-phosphate isomerase
MKNFILDYIDTLQKLLKQIDPVVVEKITKTLEETNKNRGKIFVIGNGGSSATASHMVNDLGAGLRRRGIVWFDIVSLTDNISVCSALSNDIGYENIFLAQIEGFITKDDVIIAISCSGNSQNIIKAVEYAKKVGATIVGLTGFDGGKLKDLSDINFHIETKIGEYGVVEDLHLILNHIIYSYYTKNGKKYGR